MVFVQNNKYLCRKGLVCKAEGDTPIWVWTGRIPDKTDRAHS